MRIRILGTAAGGGVPQWNCACPVCDTARATDTTRTQDCLAITGDGTAWYLMNASADLRVQLLAAPELTPPAGTRATPIQGVLLTSAELDHTVGLLSLREADRLTVYSTTTVARAVPFRAALAAYTDLGWRTVAPGKDIHLDGGLRVTPFAPGAKRPRFATAGEGGDWTVAYRVQDTRTGGALVYAPGLAQWTDAFAEGIRGADVVILDGTFAAPDELGGAIRGHLSIVESLPRLRAAPGSRYLYTHLNNTNRFAIGGPAPEELAAAGARVASDGELLEM